MLGKFFEKIVNSNVPIQKYSITIGTQNLIQENVYISMILFVVAKFYGKKDYRKSQKIGNYEWNTCIRLLWKINCLLEAVNYNHKALHLGCCSSPRSASEKVYYAIESFRSCKKVWFILKYKSPSKCDVNAGIH